MSLEKTKVRVKVCGITSLLDMLAAMGSGADMIGLNFAPRSPRCISLDKAERILNDAPRGIERVGVFQDASPQEVSEAVKRLELHYVQLHGNEDPADYRDSGARLVKAFAVSDAADVEAAGRSSADLILLDSRSPLGGGSGKTFDWSLLKSLQREFILAGGLNPENVAEAILELHPFGVDVCSGVESAPGKKNKTLLKSFVDAARSAEERVFSSVRGR